MLVLLDPLFVTFTDRDVTVLPGDKKLDAAFAGVALVHSRAVAWQMVAFRRLVLTVLNRYEEARKETR